MAEEPQKQGTSSACGSGAYGSIVRGLLQGVNGELRSTLDSLEDILDEVKHFVNAADLRRLAAAFGYRCGESPKHYDHVSPI